jgi:DNA-binding response OmpR family regulator
MGLGEAIAEADRCLSLARRVGKERILSSADAVSCPRQRVLIAEDDELVRLALRRLLEQEGFEVTATEDGAAALDAAQSGLYSLVVSDVRMPRLDGYELLSCLRRMPALSQTPVVLLTAMGSEQDIARGLDLGADDYIVKPFSSVELAARLRRLLKKGAS